MMGCKVTFNLITVRLFSIFHSNNEFNTIINFDNKSKNIDCGYSLEPPRRGGSNEYPQSML